MPGYREQYSDTYRRDDWDYGQSAWYFITICTDRRLPYFGEVREGRVGLTPTGCVAAHYWQKIAELNERVVLDAFVVMPNHVHGLLGLLPDGGSEESAPSPKKGGEAAEASLDSNDASSGTSHSSHEASTDCNRTRARTCHGFHQSRDRCRRFFDHTRPRSRNECAGPSDQISGGSADSTITLSGVSETFGGFGDTYRRTLLSGSAIRIIRIG